MVNTKGVNGMESGESSVLKMKILKTKFLKVSIRIINEMAMVDTSNLMEIITLVFITKSKHCL